MYVKIVRNENVNSSMIHHIRRSIRNGPKESRILLGTNISDIGKEFPIKNRKFDIWILKSDLDSIIGAISFKVNEDGIAFIRQFFIVPQFRNQGYGRRILSNLIIEYPKIDCLINPGNIYMYQLAESVGIKRHKPSQSMMKLCGSDKTPLSRCWSNYLSEDNYV